MKDKYYKSWHSKKDYPESRAHEGVFSMVESLQTAQQDVESEYGRYFAIYSGRNVSGLRPGQAERPLRISDIGKTRVNLNVTQSCVDTLASKIATVRPRPQFLTDGGNWKLRQKAKQLEQFVESVFEQNSLYQQQAKQVFCDAALFGTGFLKIFDRSDKICCERVFPGEIMIDEQSALFDKPRSMFQRKWVSAEVLKSAYAKKENGKRDGEVADAIDEAAGNSDIYQYSGDQMVAYDLVEVIEAWHLPSGRDEKDGRHCICINGKTLLDEQYDCDDFPFVVFRWNALPVGFYGQGLVEQLEGLQAEINKLAHRIQDSMNIFATSWVLAEKGSVNKAHFKNTPGTIIEYERGQQPPAVVQTGSVEAGVYRHLETLINKAYQISGVSQLTASGVKPSGVESGVAMRTLLDVETERFAQLSRDWEHFFISAAKKVVGTAKKLYEGERVDYRAHWIARDFVKTIKWSDVDMDADSYVLKVYPTNMLPSTPAGKLSTVQDMLRLGLLDQTQALSLLDYPDMESAQRLNAAGVEELDMVLDTILYEGSYIPPEPFQNLEFGIARAQSKILRARIERAPEDRIQMLQDWIEDASMLLQPPPAPVPEMGMPVPGMGMAPPTGGEALSPPELPGEVPTDVPLKAVG